MKRNCPRRPEVTSLLYSLLAFGLGFLGRTALEAVAQDSQAPKPSQTAAGPASAAPQANKAQAAPRLMHVRVVDSSGRAMPGAKVHASLWTKEPVKANRDYLCDAQGEAKVELPKSVDILRLWARTEGHVPLFAHWESDELEGDASRLPDEFTFTLRKGTVIGGFVKNEDGQPIAGVKVQVMLSHRRSERQRVLDNTWLAEGDDARTTDAQGRWKLDNVPSGDDVELRLRLGHADYISDYPWGAMQDHAQATTAVLRSQTGTIVMARGVRAGGIVTDPSEKPVAGAVVVWGDDPYLMPGSQEVRTDERGAYCFPPLPPMTLNITVIAQGWSPEMKKATLTWENPPVNFQLQPGKTIRLRFVDEAGKPIPEVGVGIAGWRGAKSLYNHRHPNVLDTQVPCVADKNGVYRWNWAPPDQVEYYFGKQGYQYVESSPYTADGAVHEVRLSR